jgi:hypothetical protein
MKTPVFLLAALFGLITASFSHAQELADLKVLYFGSEHAADYADFLKGKVAQIEVKNRAVFKLNDAEPFDVVLFYWPQGEETLTAQP